MNDHRRQILDMLAEGKLTVNEAERLLAALESGPAAASYASTGNVAGTPVKTRAKYVRVLVEADEAMTGKKGSTTVNVRVPLQLLRAGVRLASLIPVQAHNQLDEAFLKHGLPMTLSQIKPENLEELIDQLEDLTVDVEGKEGNGTKVRVFCE